MLKPTYFTAVIDGELCLRIDVGHRSKPRDESRLRS